jgi:F-type H+-transporting ATPase subunit delta
MKISKQARREAKQLFRCCMEHGVMDENRVRQAVTRVAAAKPRGYIAILSHFQRLVKLQLELRTARVESPAPLAPGLEADVKAGLSRLYGPGLDFLFTRNAALLGGLRVKVGSDVYDGSIQARLAALEESL